MDRDSLSLDARAVLSHLNEMGYRNITAVQLKEFMKDLRKLIKYEERLGVIESEQNDMKATSKKPTLYENLHRMTTSSFRAKHDNKHTSNAHKETVDPKPLHDKQNILPEIDRLSLKDRTPRSTTQKRNLETRRTVSSESKDKHKRKDSVEPSSTNKTSKTKLRRKRSKSTPRECSSERPGSKMWIRPKSVCSKKPQTHDPVELYQYYKKEWERFKPNLPGENSHSELRWAIRHKLMGCD